MMKSIQDLYEYASDNEIGDNDEYVYLDVDILNEDAPEIALCTLSAYNIAKAKTPQDMERPLELLVRALNELLDYQDYPVLAAKNSTENRRPLGVGIYNLAHWLAKNDFKYSDNSGIESFDELMEAFQYYLIKASVQVAKEKGACPKFNETKYSKGIMPIDTYKKALDTEVVAHKERMDWDWLRDQVKTYGMANSTLSAGMPAECQSLNNEILLEGGESIRLDELIQEYGMVDIEAVHSSGVPGQRFNLIKPVKLPTGQANECYYNGPQEVTEIEFEDGSVHRFTNNHLLRVIRDGVEQWVAVKDLTEDDDIKTL